ncbi:MAG: aminomethyl-transferring glycine dehydrogenase subunit GcvPA [Candidatus Sericytochromatia bacterium]|nr:aminomethyl-transferring glycine dehydrogenase subunit GcvPA [Candidatus Sericytochromatia bacterium]
MNPYLPLSADDRREMLAEVGFPSFEAMVAHVPARLRLPELRLPEGLSEFEVQAAMRDLAARNRVPDGRTFLGAGVYQRFVPAAVDALVSRAEFYTAYTPYQPEVSQGTLQYTYEYQSLICALTGMDVSNASLYDASTAVAEAAFMAMRITGRRDVVVADTVHPEYVEVLRTYARGPEPTVRLAATSDGLLDPESLPSLLSSETACLVVQTPNFLGLVEAMPALAEAAHAVGALLVAVVDPVSLAVLTPPGDYGADIVVGDGQSVGNLPQFGGPHVGFMACRSEHFRQLPGRIVGATVDSRGDRAYTLTLQTREQHIRREKATSNICTNQALCALAVTVYLSLAGAEGLRQVAETSAARAHDLARRIAALPGYQLAHAGPFLHEFVVRAPVPAAALLEALEAQGILGGVALERWFPDRERDFLVAVTEVNTPAALEAFVAALAACASATVPSR